MAISRISEAVEEARRELAENAGRDPTTTAFDFDPSREAAAFLAGVHWHHNRPLASEESAIRAAQEYAASATGRGTIEGRAPDPDITGLELTEQICFDKVKKERDAYREAQTALLDKFATMARPQDILLVAGEMTAQEMRTARAIANWYLSTARSLLSQSTEGE